MKRLLQRVEDKARRSGAAGPPAHDPSGIDVDDERDINKAAPGGDIGEIGHPELGAGARSRAPAAPTPDSSGLMPATIDPGAEGTRPASPMSTRPTAKPNGRSLISPGLRASCRSTSMAAIARSPSVVMWTSHSVGRTCAAASLPGRGRSSSAGEPARQVRVRDHPRAPDQDRGARDRASHASPVKLPPPCTVLVNGDPVFSCITEIGSLADAEITTLEGLGTVAKPHPLQQAFIDEQAAQCGYCSNGMIMSAKALLDRNPRPSEEQVRDRRARTPRHFGETCEEPGNLRSAPNAWWRTQSPSNPSPAPNSLLTGKLTGNFAKSGLTRRFSRLLRQQIQCLAEKFPTQRNREFLEP